MKALDKQYLSLQFKLKVHQKNATAFQTFFEDVMKRAYKERFQTIRPYGKIGDGGNDGYIPDEGKYFQVYAPSIVLMRTLYEKKLINFADYLDFHSYLSSYRYRLLPVSVHDLEKTLFGDGDIRQIRTEELRKINIPLVLSEEYGVPPQRAAALTAQFLLRLLVDDSILPEVMQSVFSRIIEDFPTKQDKNSFGKLLLVSCVKALNNPVSVAVVGHRTQEKVDALVQFIETYTQDGEIIIP